MLIEMYDFLVETESGIEYILIGNFERFYLQICGKITFLERLEIDKDRMRSLITILHQKVN